MRVAWGNTHCFLYCYIVIGRFQSSYASLAFLDVPPGPLILCARARRPFPIKLRFACFLGRPWARRF